jgi:hypothetical protein
MTLDMTSISQMTPGKLLIREKKSVKNAQNDEIENVAGSVRLSPFTDGN